MYLTELFRSFRPLHNPIGFGVADFVLLALTLLLASLIVLRPLLASYISRITSRTPLAMGLLASLAITLRLALLGSAPVPTPGGADDFSYLLSADTLTHLRLANTTPVLHQFFESVFVLQQPTYSSIFPLGQGLVLAIGSAFGNFWFGVLASISAFCALSYWMLSGWISSRWALLGGLLAMIQFGPMNQWTNSYWGGAVSACAGCLVFGALPRSRTTRNAALLGLGLGLQLLTRPFEFVLLLICVAAYWLPSFRLRQTAIAFVAFLPALGLTALQNKHVTGSWTTLPYMLSRYQYGVPTTFTFQAVPIPHRDLTPEQDLDYRAQSVIHGDNPESASQYLGRLGYRLRYLRFFWLPPLFLAAFAFLPSLRQPRWLFVAATIAVFLLGTNFYPYFFPHYIAALTCLFVLVAVKGLENLSRIPYGGRRAANLLLFLCGAHFLFWYGLRLFNSENLLPATAYQTWDFLNSGDPQGRIGVNETLARSVGPQLVFVRYSSQHRFEEWIANAADIDSARVVWARDLGSAENNLLLPSFPRRKAWLLESDVRPPRLSSYPTAPR